MYYYFARIVKKWGRGVVTWREECTNRAEKTNTTHTNNIGTLIFFYIHDRKIFSYDEKPIRHIHTQDFFFFLKKQIICISIFILVAQNFLFLKNYYKKTSLGYVSEVWLAYNICSSWAFVNKKTNSQILEYWSIIKSR